jgi:hypothetical protein
MNFARSLGWGGATLLGIVLLGANAFWISWEARLPTGWSCILVIQWLCVLASLLIVCLLAGWLARGRAIGIFVDERNRISLARFQWVLWFLVLFSSYFTGAVWDAAFGGDLPAIEPDLFGVIGLVTGSAVISNVLVDAKKRETQTNPADQNLVGKIDTNVSPDDASWEDLYLGEEEGNRNSIDVSRFQKLVVTFVLVIVYMQMCWQAFVQASTAYDAFAMPIVGGHFLILLGSSHAAYLAYKATPKTPSAAAA